ncbi:MAG: NAD(P)-dependent oxidoreductase [Bacteroidota bacterium]
MEFIKDEAQLEEMLSQPSKEVIEMMKTLDGDFMLLGIAGKIGPSLARMIKRACKEAGVEKKIYGVSRFSDETQKVQLEQEGFIIIKGDLLDGDFIKTLPKVKNVIFLAGMKFGSEDNLSLTWAMNSYLPALVAEYFTDSRIVAFSTGCVYELMPVGSGGSKETDIPLPVGEYAQSCLGRERMFEFGSKKYGNDVALIRLNYAVEPRYGVLVDVAKKVWNNEPVDLTMGFFNFIWQGEANGMTIRALSVGSSPAKILNVTGEDTISVKYIAAEFAKHFGKEVTFTGEEAKTALLSNASESFQLFGKPKVSVDQMIRWTAHWMMKGGRDLGKPTHFEVRDGKY